MIFYGFKIIWITIYLESIFINKLSKCINGTPLEPLTSYVNQTYSSQIPDANEEYISSSPEIPVESSSFSISPSSELVQSTIYNDQSLMDEIRPLEKFQIIDLLDIVVTKLKNKDSSYDFQDDLNKFIKSSFNLVPVILNISEYTRANNYIWRTSGNIIICTAMAGYGFKLVRQNESILWHTIKESEYAGKIECNYDNNTIKIYKIDQTTQEINFVNDLQYPINLLNNNIQSNINTNKLPVVLNIYELINTDQYKWSIENDILTCIPNDGYLFKLVKQFQTILWHTINLKNGSNKVECNYKTNKVIIYKIDQTKEEIDFTPEMGQFGNLVVLDIKEKKNTNLITYKKEDEFDVFQTVSPCLFRRIYNGSTLIWNCEDGNYPYTVCVGEKKGNIKNMTLYFQPETINFYDLDNEEGYIEYEYGYDDEDDKDEHYIDGLNNNEKEKFKLINETRKDEEIENEEIDNNKLEKIIDTKGLQFTGIDENNNTYVIDATNIKHEQFEISTCINFYIFDSDTKCVKVKHEDKDVWSYDDHAHTALDSQPKVDTSPPGSSQVVSTHSGDDFSQHTGSDSVVSQDESGNDSKQTGDSYSTENKYPIEVLYNTESNVISIIFDDEFLEYIYIEEKWVLVINNYIYNKNDEFLIDETQGLQIYTFKTEKSISENDLTKFEFKIMGRNKSILVFKLKENSKCVLVERRGEKIWSRDDYVTPMDSNEKEYPVQVSYHVEANAVFVIFKETYLGYLYANNKWELKVIKNYKKLDDQSILEQSEEQNEYELESTMPEEEND